MPLPAPLSLSQFANNFMANWAIAVNVTSVSSIPASDPIWGVAQSSGGASLYLQGSIYQLVAISRASTATGADLDSWLADFDFDRPEGTAATVVEQVTIAIPAGQTSVIIPSGTIWVTPAITVTPATSPQVFMAETTAAYAFTANGTYNITLTATAPVTAGGQTGYGIYNSIPPTSFTTMLQPIAGVSSSTNLASPAFGSNNASDAQARADFVQYITSLSQSTLAALIAAVEDSGAGWIYQETFNLLSYATAPGYVQPGQVIGVFIGPGSGQYPGSNPDNPAMDNALAALQADVAFGITPIEYYATDYAVTAIGFISTYSQSALNAAGLTVATLEGLMTSVLQGFFSSSGDSLGVAVYFSQIARALLNISVTTSNATVTGIVVDVNIGSFIIATSGGTFQYPSTDLVQPGTPTVLNPIGYLSMASSVVPTYTFAPPAP